MPSKRDDKSKNVTDEDQWRTNIVNAELNDERFRANVALLDVAGSEQDRLYLSKFVAFAAEEKRAVVKNIDKTETMFMISQLGSGDTKCKDENSKVFEEAAVYVREKKNVPAECLAIVIKHLILKLKDEFLIISQQRLEVAEGCRRENLIMQRPTEVKGTVTSQASSPTQAPAQAMPEKGKAGNPPPATTSRSSPDENQITAEENKKYNTKLRMRGEEWRDKVYVDDPPIEGPQMYIALSGFADPFLPIALVKLGVPVVAVVQVRIDVATLHIPPSLTRLGKRGASQMQLMMDESIKFWDTMQQLRIMQPTADYLKNTAFIMFSPPYWETNELSGNSEKIYDEICYLLYDTHDLTRQHKTYLDNMYIIEIPTARDESSDKNSCFQYYSQSVEEIPLECISIYSMLDSIIDSVSKSHPRPNTGSLGSQADGKSTKVSDGSKLDSKETKAQSIVNDIFDHLCQTDNDRKTYRITYGEEYESYKDPIVINYGDIVKYTTFHLGSMNLDKIVCGMLIGMPVNQLWQTEDPKGEAEKAKISMHLNVLLSCFDREDVEDAELVRLLNMLAFRKLYNNRSSLRKNSESPETLNEFKKKYMKRSALAAPITLVPSVAASPSFPSFNKSDSVSVASPESDEDETAHVKYLFDCPDISELVSCAEIDADAPINHLIDDYDYFEDFKGTSAFQIILDAFNKYNCLDYKYCEATDSIVMMFFNSHNPEGIARDTWRSHVPTAACLQDFFDYVLDEHYEWIQEQDRIYYEALELMTRSKYSKHLLELYEHTCINETDVELEMLLEGSLKQQCIAALAAEAPPSTTEIEPSGLSVTPKSDTKHSTPRKAEPKKRKEESKHNEADELKKEQDKESKIFFGYQLGDRRVEVYGKDSSFFSKDGSKVNTMYSFVISENYEWIIMNMVPGNGNTEFWFQRVIGGHASLPRNAELSENFRINTKEHVMINIKKVTCRVQLTEVPSQEVELPPSTTFFSSVGPQPVPNLHGTDFYHMMYVTWPNGMLLESVHENDSSALSHIRLTYLSELPNLDEEMRCYTLKGEAIIYRKSGHIEVLSPDGTIVKITKCGMHPAPDKESNKVNMDKKDSKEKKVKEDKSEKKSKISSSKTGRLKANEQKVPEPAELELTIDEFEIIDTCGHRQRCQHNQLHSVEKLLVKTATDYCLGEVFMRRMDGTHYLLNKNGTYISTFPDGTRIISDCYVEDEEISTEWTPKEKNLETVEVESHDMDGSECTDSSSEARAPRRGRDEGFVSVYLVYTIEHKNFATVTINNHEATVKVDSPNGSSVVMDYGCHYEMRLDEVTTAKFDGLDLVVSYEACEQCHSFTTCDVKVSCDQLSSATQVHRPWLKMKDSYCKRIVVSEEGDISLLEDEPCSVEMPPSPPAPEAEAEAEAEAEMETEAEQEEAVSYRSHGSVQLHGKCRDLYLPHTMKFFVLNRDLSCSELVHRNLVEEYRKACLWRPWCTIDSYDTFGDYRRLLSMLTPVDVTESEKWLMESRLCGKPTRLTYKDLKVDTCEKGFYHWMRPYERFEPKPIEPDSVLPPRLPSAFILRTLELQWCEEQRPELKGAQELVRAILKYRREMEEECENILHVPIRDPRSPHEVDAYEKVQQLGKRMYENLKERLSHDLQSRMERDITSKPLPERDSETSDTGEEESIDEAAENLQMLDEIAPPDDKLANYWRRRAEELKEEEFYRYLLAEGGVPPYFRNILGGAIWWEVNQAAGDAVTRAERERLRCVCDENLCPSPQE